MHISPIQTLLILCKLILIARRPLIKLTDMHPEMFSNPNSIIQYAVERLEYGCALNSGMIDVSGSVLDVVGSSSRPIITLHFTPNHLLGPVLTRALNSYLNKRKGPCKSASSFHNPSIKVSS